MLLYKTSVLGLILNISDFKTRPLHNTRITLLFPDCGYIAVSKEFSKYYNYCTLKIHYDVMS